MLLIYDLEQFKNFHSIYVKDVDSNYEDYAVLHPDRFEIDKYYDILNKMEKGIGFNNLSYDYPLLHFILINKHNILNSKPEVVLANLYQHGQKIIKEKYSEVPKWDVLIPQIDLYRIWHFDNKAKATGLKWLEFWMDFENIEDLPISPHDEVSLDQIDEIISYNKNDVLATYEFYKKSLKHIQQRENLGKVYDIDLTNHNEPKIGSDIFAKFMSEKMNIPLNILKNMGTDNKILIIKDYILPYIKFDSKEFNSFLKMLKSRVLYSTKGALKDSVNYKGFKYDFGTGNHNCPII